MLGRLARLLNPGEYVSVDDGKYVEVGDEEAELVSKYRVPRNQRSESDEAAEELESEGSEDEWEENPGSMQSSKLDLYHEQLLSSKTDEEVARKAARYTRIKKYVLRNPEVIDASNELEAELKIEIAKGNDPTATLENNPQIDAEQTLNDLGRAWLAKLGYIQHGDSMGEKLTEAMQNGDSDAEGAADSGGDAGGEASGDVQGDASGYMGTGSDVSLNSVSIDTDAGTVSVDTGSAETGSGNGGDAGAGVSAGSSSGSGGGAGTGSGGSSSAGASGGSSGAGTSGSGAGTGAGSGGGSGTGGGS